MSHATSVNGQPLSFEPAPAPSSNGAARRSSRRRAPIANDINGARDDERQSTDAANSGRDANGRFSAGNAGGPGNPFARQTAGLRRAMLSAISEELMTEIAHTLVAQARLGDLASMKLVFLYGIGRPTTPVDPDTLNAQEWGLRREGQVPPDELTTTLNGLRPEIACALFQVAMPMFTKKLLSDLLPEIAGVGNAAALASALPLDEARAQR